MFRILKNNRFFILIDIKLLLQDKQLLAMVNLPKGYWVFNKYNFREANLGIFEKLRKIFIYIEKKMIALV